LHDALPLATAAAALVIGFLIGAVGIGGVLLPPWLIAFGGLDVRGAIAVALGSYIATGIAATVLYLRGDAVPRMRDWTVVAATMPGALAGAVTLAYVPARWPAALLAALLVVTGWRILRRGHASPRPATSAAPAADCAAGALGGFVSALTGTGGPMVLVPLQAWRGKPLLEAIATGQLAQLPIALVATAGNAATGGVDLRFAALIGALLLPGVWVGPRVAHALPRGPFTRAVALLLLATGAWLALKVIGGGA
jgi:uncharacterized membrane protein YfcA